MGPPETPASSRGTKSMRTSESAPTMSRTSSRVLAPDYRDSVLRPNGVVFELSSKDLPDNVQASIYRCEQYLAKSSDQKMTVEQAMTLIDLFEHQNTSSETAFCTLLHAHNVFPSSSSYLGFSCVLDRIWFKDGLPRSDFPLAYLPITIPKPDCVYGYLSTAFSVRQEAKAQSRLFMACGSLYWPFLVIEAKSQSMGTNTYQAANQCAGGGTVSVNAIVTLLDQLPSFTAEADATQQVVVEESRGGEKDPTATGDLADTRVPSDPSSITLAGTGPTHGSSADSSQLSAKYPEPVVFSLAVDSMTAALYVHWRSQDRSCFYLQRIAAYMMIRPEELIQLQTKVQEIIAWGMGPRLTAIKQALDLWIEHEP